MIVAIAAFGVAFAALLLAGRPDARHRQLAAAARARSPITLSPTEPFTTTVKVSAYGAAILSLPIILYQVYAFIIPAFSPAGEARRVALHDRDAAAVHRRRRLHLLPRHARRRSSSCSTSTTPTSTSQVRAGDYYTFLGVLVVLMGLLFQMPIALLALCRLGVITPEQLSDIPPLRDPDHRDRLRGGPRRRPGEHVHDHDPAAAALRGERPARQALRPAERAAAVGARSRGLGLEPSRPTL